MAGVEMVLYGNVYVIDELLNDIRKEPDKSAHIVLTLCNDDDKWTLMVSAVDFDCTLGGDSAILLSIPMSRLERKAMAAAFDESVLMGDFSGN